MVSSTATTVEHHLAELPAEKRPIVAAVRDMVNAHILKGYRETMAFGMIGWCIALSRYPETYNSSH